MLYLSHLMSDNDMADLLEEYHLGVETIEFSIGYCLDEWRAKAAAYQERLKAMEWEGPLTVHGPFLDLDPVSWDSKIAQASRERFSQAYQAAWELGARKIVYHTCFVPMINFLEGWADRMIEFWNGFLTDKGREITVCLENVFDPEYAPLLKIAQAVSHPAFGLCFDVGHAHCFTSHPAREWLENLYPYVRHLHLHDNHGVWDEHLGMGQGTLPWKEILGFIQEKMPQTDAVLENSAREYCEASIATLKEFGIFQQIKQDW